VEIAGPSAPDSASLKHRATMAEEAVTVGDRPSFLSVRLHQNWDGNLVVQKAAILLEQSGTPERNHRFAEFLALLNAGQLQALESALAASETGGVDRSTELALLWSCWVGLCPASAQLHAGTDPQRTRHFEQAVSSMSAAREAAILSQLTQP
jgi:hypothetical protein